MRSRAGTRVAALVIGLVAALVAVVAFDTDAFENTENDSVDARFDIRGERYEPGIAVVAIDGQSFSELGVAWPFPRRLHARMIKRLSAAGASAIAYDVQFTERTTVARRQRADPGSASRRQRRPVDHRGRPG